MFLFLQKDVGVSTAIFILHETPHRLFIYDFGNVQRVQSGDEIIYFSRQQDEILRKCCLDYLSTKTSYPHLPSDYFSKSQILDVRFYGIT